MKSTWFVAFMGLVVACGGDDDDTSDGADAASDSDDTTATDPTLTDATADDIDVAMKQGCALPMGPFELLDVVGNDVSLAIQRELYLEFREPGFATAPLLEHLVTAGYLGRKTQQGFRDYSKS